MGTGPRHGRLLGAVPGLSVRVLHRPPSARVVLSGELDLQTAGTLRATVARLERSCWSRYEVDLERVGFADCTGARPLVDLARAAAGRGGEMVLWGPSPRVALVLAHLGLLHATTHPSALTPRAGAPREPRS